MLIDTHFHLDFEQFDADREAIIERAVAAGVTRMITIGTTLVTSRNAVELADRYAEVYAAVGIHPTHANEWSTEAEATLHEWANHPKVVAIGEIGLDYYWDWVAPHVEQVAFEAQLALAAGMGLPVIIHDRDAHAETLATLQRWGAGLPDDAPRGVLHCFSGDLALAREALALGFYLGVDGPVTYKKAESLKAIVTELPLERWLIETDAPFLTPHPHRGKRNEPAYVRYVAEEIARLRAVPFETVAAQTTANARTLFRKL